MKRFARIWHRRLGLLLAIPVLLLTVSGILINHSTALGWNQQPVFSALLARLYGVPKSAPSHGYRLDDRWLVQLGDQLILDDDVLTRCTGELLGVARSDTTLALWCGRQLLLIHDNGELLEALPLPPQAQTLAGNERGFRITDESAAWWLDEMTGQWQQQPITEAGKETLPVMQPVSLPPALRDALTARQPLPGISRERVLLDLHSGRLFGWPGVLLVDLIGIGLGLMVLSGVWTSLRRKKRRV